MLRLGIVSCCMPACLRYDACRFFSLCNLVRYGRLMMHVLFGRVAAVYLQTFVCNKSQAAAAAAERRARDNVWCPCSNRDGFLSAEDAVIVEEMPAPVHCRPGARAAPPKADAAPAPSPPMQACARRSRSAAAPQEILDLTLSDEDDAHPAASQGR